MFFLYQGLGHDTASKVTQILLFANSCVKNIAPFHSKFLRYDSTATVQKLKKNIFFSRKFHHLHKFNIKTVFEYKTCYFTKWKKFSRQCKEVQPNIYATCIIKLRWKKKIFNLSSLNIRRSSQGEYIFLPENFLAWQPAHHLNSKFLLYTWHFYFTFNLWQNSAWKNVRCMKVFLCLTNLTIGKYQCRLPRNK